MRALKRIVVLLIELVAEAVLLGLLFGVLMSSQTGLLYGVVDGSLILPVILFLNWYYLTRSVAGLALRFHRPWLYPTVVAGIFIAHMCYIITPSRLGLTPFGHATVLRFIVGGVCIVFACAFAGDWLLRKWEKAGSKQPEPLVSATS
jgi:hypothetical protein